MTTDTRIPRRVYLSCPFDQVLEDEGAVVGNGGCYHAGMVVVQCQSVVLVIIIGHLFVMRRRVPHAEHSGVIDTDTATRVLRRVGNGRPLEHWKHGGEIEIFHPRG